MFRTNGTPRAQEAQERCLSGWHGVYRRKRRSGAFQVGTVFIAGMPRSGAFQVGMVFDLKLGRVATTGTVRGRKPSIE